MLLQNKHYTTLVTLNEEMIYIIPATVNKYHLATNLAFTTSSVKQDTLQL